MPRYIALLRGVNVGGVNIKMVELAEVFRGLGYDDVKTVLASGNVVFTAAVPASTAKPAIEAALRERFGYQAWVHVLTTDALASVIDAYPFAERDDWHRYVLFLMDDGPRAALLATPVDPALEAISGGDDVIYWTVERGHTLDSAFGKRSGTGKDRASVTNRNLNTLQKLLR